MYQHIVSHVNIGIMMYYISYYFNEINFSVIRGRKPITRERSVFCIIFFYLVTYLFINV